MSKVMLGALEVSCRWDRDEMRANADRLVREAARRGAR
jgi:hypothetical protein